MRTLFLALITCLFVLPAYAKYSGGTGEPNDPYQISTAEDLMLLGESPEDYDKHFILTEDIDLDPNLPGRKVFNKAVIAPDTYDGSGTPFTGVLDGNGHTISHVTIKGGYNLGLVGQLGSLYEFGGEVKNLVKNLGVVDANVTGYGDNVGAMVGANYGTVTNSYSTCIVGGAQRVGGLVGDNWCAVTSCYSTGVVSGTEDVGGYPILWWQLPPKLGLPTFSGGAGEPNDPYLVSKAEDLCSIGHNPRLMRCRFKVVANLDLTGARFYPIGNYDYPYGGVFDGNGHTISHLTINGVSYVGVFGQSESGAVVKDLGLVDVNITGSGDCVGGLVGSNGGTVTTCYSTGLVSSTGEYSLSIGGLVGKNGGTVTHCYSSAAVSSTGQWLWCTGGLVGSNSANVAHCYSTGAVVGDGGLIGANHDMMYPWGRVTVTASFWDTQTSGRTYSAAGTGKTTAEMQTASTFLEAGWDFVGETANGTEDIWWILEGKDYPRLWWETHDN